MELEPSFSLDALSIELYFVSSLAMSMVLGFSATTIRSPRGPARQDHRQDH